MKIRVLLNGANGRMGQVTSRALENADAVDYRGGLGKDDDLAGAIVAEKADVVVDFTTPQAVLDNIICILTAGARPVVGTTGLKTADVSRIEKLCSELKRGAIIAPNFSIAAVLMMQFAAKASHYYPHIEIIEAHHPGKKDAPSGTALKTAEMIAKENSVAKPVHDEKKGRGFLHHGIPIHAVRLPGVVANQSVILGGEGETLTIAHNTINRECFMPGVLMACRAVMKQSKLVVGLEGLL